MSIGDLVPVEHKSGVTIYGRVLNSQGKLGQYEVHSDHLGHNGWVYTTLKEAEERMSQLIGVHVK